MAFSKTIFVNNQTVIDAATLNAIQDELIQMAAVVNGSGLDVLAQQSGHPDQLILDGVEGISVDNRLVIHEGRLAKGH